MLVSKYTITCCDKERQYINRDCGEYRSYYKMEVKY